MDIYTLDTPEVLHIYDYLVAEFAQTEDPIEPAGVRDINLLESAVLRQSVSNGSVLKYRTPTYNAATLGYGICNNHPFYNGNKRTALVSILAHLDKNKLSLRVGEDELYDFMISVANHAVAEWVAERLNIDIVFGPGEGDSDVEVRMMGRWLVYHAAPVRRGEDKKITYRELRKILQRFGYDLVNPSSARIHIVKKNSDGTFTNIHSVYYPGEGREVSLTVIKAIRARCELREEDGVDSDTFYWNALQIPEFVNEHRLVLRRLADS
jgi:death-on-curing protein